MRITIPAPVPRFPDHIAAPAPIGMRANVRRAAEQAGISSAAFIRSAVEEQLRKATPSITTAAG